MIKSNPKYGTFEEFPCHWLSFRYLSMQHTTLLDPTLEQSRCVEVEPSVDIGMSKHLDATMKSVQCTCELQLKLF